MSFSFKNKSLGSFWTIAFFLLSFARTLILTPLMLTHWGKEVFCFWALLLSARALICFLPDTFIRYVINEYNIRFHRDPAEAAAHLRAGMSFLLVLTLCLCALSALLFGALPGVVAFIFDVAPDTSALYGLGGSLFIYLVAACVQLLQRLYAGVREPAGLIWQNLLMESLLLSGEVILLSQLITKGYSFSSCVWADSLIIISAALIYLVFLLLRHRPGPLLARQNRKNGRLLFVQAGRLYAGNFFEKASSDSLLLLLSFFRFDKAAIAVFATVKTLVNAPLLGANLLLNARTPELQRHFTLGDDKRLQQLLLFVRGTLISLLLLAMVCCYPFYKPLFLVWTRNRLPYDGTFICLMLSAAMLNLYGLAYLFVLKGTNAMRPFLNVMLLKTLLILSGLAVSGRLLHSAAWVWLWSELVCSVFLLPLWTRTYLRQPSRNTDLIFLFPPLASIAMLAFFDRYQFSICGLMCYLLSLGLAGIFLLKLRRRLS